VSEERRRGTLTMSDEPRGENVAGGLFSEYSFVSESDDFCCSSSRPVTLHFPVIVRGFLMIEEALLPMLSSCRPGLVPIS